MGKAHATMYTDEAKGRLKTGGAIFAETSAVIPAQAGIQTSAFRKYFKTAAISNFWIPACAGMTGGKSRV